MSDPAGGLVTVTGGTGAVGRRVVDDLVAEGWRVRALSRTPPADPGIEHVAYDLVSGEPIPVEALHGCVAVVHLASYIPRNQEDPATADLCLRTNALGTLRLLEAMEAAGVSRFIQTTSANAYAPELEAPSEQDSMFPSARAPFYLSSKIVQDILAAYWGERRRMAATTLRVSTVYGAGMEQSLFTRFAGTLRAGGPIRLVNGGSFGADFVDVSDVSAAVRLFLRNGATGAFNVASGRRTTLLEAARLLLDLCACGDDQLVVEQGASPEIGFPRMDITKARAQGFEPTDLRSGLERLVAWVNERRST